MQIGLYILECHNGRYYIGSSKDLDRRLHEHMAGKVTATRNLRPIRLIFFQPYDTILMARKMEYALKRKKSRTIIEEIIQDGFIRFTI